MAPHWIPNVQIGWTMDHRMVAGRPPRTPRPRPFTACSMGVAQVDAAGLPAFSAPHHVLGLAVWVAVGCKSRLDLRAPTSRTRSVSSRSVARVEWEVAHRATASFVLLGGFSVCVLGLVQALDRYDAVVGNGSAALHGLSSFSVGPSFACSARCTCSVARARSSCCSRSRAIGWTNQRWRVG